MLVLQRISILFFLLFLVISGCDRPEEITGDEVVRIGDRTLTRDQIHQSLLEIGLNPEEESLRSEFISSWIDRILLIFEAEKNGYHREAEFNDRLQDIRDEMLIKVMLEKAVDIDSPDQEKILDYWQLHTGEFTRSEDAVRLIVISTNDRNNAWGIRNSLDKSRPASEILSMYEDIELDSVGWIAESRLPGEFRKHLQRLRVNDPSLPFEMNQRWFVVKLLNRSKTGDPKELEEVADEIRSRLVAEQRMNLQINYLAGLRREARRKGIVQINYSAGSVLQNDSLSHENKAHDNVEADNTTP